MKYLYSEYCKNKPKSDCVVSEFSSYFEKLRISINCQNDITQLLMSPVNRIMRYQLLISAIKDNMKKESIPLNQFSEAIEISKMIAGHANEVMTIARLEKCDEKLPNQYIRIDTVLVAESNDSIKRLKIDKLNFNKKKVFLFESKIIFAEIKGVEGSAYFYYEFKNKIAVIIIFFSNKDNLEI